MNIDVYTVCYNEELFLPFFLRHYERFARSITVFDNNSTDSSQIIIKNHSLCKLIPFTGVGRDELTKIKNECWKDSDADWVIVCDIDELIYHPNILYLFDNLRERYPIWKPQAYTMVAEDFHSDFSEQIWEMFDKGVRTPFYDKCSVFDPKIIRQMNYFDNGHVCKPEPSELVFNDSELRLLHYRFLDLNYTKKRFQVLKERFGKRINWADYSEPVKVYQQFSNYKKICIPPLNNRQLIHINWIDDEISLL